MHIVRPVNWYAALVVILLVGLGSIAFAKYNYDRSPSSVQPTVGTSWNAALAFDICGTMQPALPASPSGASTGLTTSGNGVLVVAPVSVLPDSLVLLPSLPVVVLLSVNGPLVVRSSIELVPLALCVVVWAPVSTLRKVPLLQLSWLVVLLETSSGPSV